VLHRNAGQTTPAAGADSHRRRLLRNVLTLAALVLPGRRALAALADSYPPNDVRHYGLVPNSPAAASANTTALQALVRPAGTFTGQLTFPNTTGADVWHFNDLIAFHDGVHLDLLGSTLSFVKTGVARDSASGFIHAIRDFVIENGAIETSYVFKGGYDAGNVLAFGGRGRDTALFPDIYDRLLARPMGNIVVRNLRIRGGTSGGSTRGIFMLGGFDGVVINGVTIDGQGQLTEGIYYEFGWATNEPREQQRYTSHARNIRVTNLTVTNVANEAFGAMGAYDIVIDGLRVSNVGHACLIGTGESLYYRPWVPSGDLSRRPSFVARNVAGEAITSMAIGVTGASKLSGSYLSNPPANDNPLGITADQQTDLIDFVLERFSLSGSVKNFGVWTSARSAQITNGSLVGFQRGIVTTRILDICHAQQHLWEVARLLDPDQRDWLAAEFRDGGQSFKALHRLLVTSATYRQSSRVTPDRLAKDPANRLLSRGSRFRLDAEMLPLALVIVILGGTGSLFGAFVGSFIVGFLYNFGQALLPELAYFVLFLPMVLVLVLRPQGLFGGQVL